MQKTKNRKFLCIFSPGSSRLKFYYIKHLCKMELLRKFKFFRFFHYKTILFSSESEFSMKNVFFWGTSYWCSSKIREIGRGNLKLQLQLMSPPFNFLNFWASSTWCTSKEHIFPVEFRLRRNNYSFAMKNCKKSNFLVSSIPHRSDMY